LLATTINEQSPVILLSRIVDASGNPVTQSEVSDLTCSVWDTTANTETGITLDVSTCISDNLIAADPRWTADTIGYNLILEIDGSYFPSGGHIYRVELNVLPSAGNPYSLVWEFIAQTIYSSSI